jgi:predicted ABC-type ATPase
MAANQPGVIVLAGPNGAGKSTSARALLAETLSVMTYVNADLIAQGLSGFDPEGAAVQAGRIMLRRIRELTAQRADFAFETTLAGRTYARWLREFREDGYHLHLEYFWLVSADLAVSRVAERVRNGGHDVPEATFRQRYQRSLENFFTAYSPLMDSWRVHDNSGPAAPVLVAQSQPGAPELVVNEGLWALMGKGAGR